MAAKFGSPQHFSQIEKLMMAHCTQIGRLKLAIYQAYAALQLVDEPLQKRAQNAGVILEEALTMLKKDNGIL